MAGEVTVPLLPCASVDVMADFYTMLGFELTYRQTRPNPYIAMRREDLHLHFFALPDFDPEQSYSSCLVYVPDTGALFQAFAEGMRAAHGKLLISGIPRMTRPRKRKNTGDLSGFSVVDPGGNWIRIFQAPGHHDGQEAEDEPPLSAQPGKLARSLRNAIVLGESKGDPRQAAKILDGALAQAVDSASVVDRVAALVYRAELAVVLQDGERADMLLAQVRETPLGQADRARLGDALANAADLESPRRSDR